MKEFLIFLPITILYLAFKSALLPNLPMPDLPVVLVFYLAYRKASIEGAVFAFVLGYIDDAFSGGIMGSTAFSLVFIYLAVHFGAKKVHFSTPAIRAAGAGFFALLKGILMYFILRFAGLGADFLARAVFQAVMTGIFAPAIITFLVRLTSYLTPQAFKDDVN